LMIYDLKKPRRDARWMAPIVNRKS